VENCVKSKEKVTAYKLLPKISEKVSLRTLQKVMKEDKNLTYKKIPKKICLSQLQMQKRVSIIREWFAKRVNFENVIFSDESRFSLDGPDHFMSWQLPQYSESFSRLKRPCNGGGIMVHGVLHLDGTLSLDRVEGKINGKKYIELLKDRVLPILNTRYGDNFTWQCDNATPYTCATTKKNLKRTKSVFLNGQLIAQTCLPLS